MTLVNAALGQKQTRLRQAALVLGGSFFVAIAAQVNVPMFPVPMTLQTLAILLVGLSFGARLGAVTVLAYLAQGAMGLPVFANAGSTTAFFGPTAGFLIGFVALAWIVGFAAERGFAKSVVSTTVVCVLASTLLYVPGVVWPMAIATAFGFDASWSGQAFGSYYWTYFVAPFLVGDAVKAVIAALILTGARTALKAR